jgi:hypothetical protein
MVVIVMMVAYIVRLSFLSTCQHEAFMSGRHRAEELVGAGDEPLAGWTLGLRWPIVWEYG